MGTRLSRVLSLMTRYIPTSLMQSSPLVLPSSNYTLFLINCLVTFSGATLMYGVTIFSGATISYGATIFSGATISYTGQPSSLVLPSHKVQPSIFSCVTISYGATIFSGATISYGATIFSGASILIFPSYFVFCKIMPHSNYIIQHNKWQPARGNLMGVSKR